MDAVERRLLRPLCRPLKRAPKMGDAFADPRLKPGATDLLSSSPAFRATAANALRTRQSRAWNVVELHRPPCVAGAVCASEVLVLVWAPYATDVSELVGTPCVSDVLDLVDAPCASDGLEIGPDAGTRFVAPGFSRGFSNATLMSRARFSGRQRPRA
jgi:hypothetical protein